MPLGFFRAHLPRLIPAFAQEYIGLGFDDCGRQAGVKLDREFDFVK